MIQLPLSSDKRKSLFLSVLSLPLMAAGDAWAAPATTHHHLRAQLDSYGLPGQYFEGLLRSKDARTLRSVLQQTPRHDGDEDARASWLAGCLSVEGNEEEAIDQFKKVKHLEAAPNYVLFLVGRSSYQAGNIPEARKLASMAIERQKACEFYELRGSCYDAEKRYKEAAADYESAAAANPRYANGMLCKAAQSLLKANEAQKALAVLNKIPSSNDPALFVTKGQCLENLKRYDQAIIYFNKCITAPHVNIGSGANFIYNTCMLERANCYDKLGRHAEAAADRKAIEREADKLSRDILGK